MIYSYTQISQYLRCPRSYRYRYLDGWREKDTRAAMVFGRCFEKALGAYFCGEDSCRCSSRNGAPSAILRLNTRRESPGIAWSIRESICSKFAQDDRVHIPQPQEESAGQDVLEPSRGNEFVSYIDAIGELDGQRCLIDWKTTTSRYPEEPDGIADARPAADLLFLDQRNFRCGCWSSSCESISLRFNTSRPSISEEQRREFGRLVETTIARSKQAVPFSQRHPLPAERLHELPSSGALSR